MLRAGLCERLDHVAYPRRKGATKFRITAARNIAGERRMRASRARIVSMLGREIRRDQSLQGSRLRRTSAFAPNLTRARARKLIGLSRKIGLRLEGAIKAELRRTLSNAGRRGLDDVHEFPA